MLTRRSLVLVCALALAGCGFFAALTGDSQAQAQADAEAEARRQAEQAARQQEQADQQLATELDSLRAKALAEAATLQDAGTYVESYCNALRTGAVERGRVPASHGDDAWASLDAQAAQLGDGKTPEALRDRATVEVFRGALRFEQGRPDEAAGHFLAAIELEPSYELFSVLITVPKSPISDAAVLQACPQVRPAITSEQLPDFVAVCLDAAAGDRKQLTWKTAKADLKAHDVEMERRAEEERLRQEQEARLAAEQAALAAQAELWATAAVFAAGNCRFSNCMTDGWETSTDQGTVTTTCRFSNCLKDGWETRLPDGSTATTSCRFSDCFKDGWETSMPSGRITCSCRFSDCLKDGTDCG